MNLHSQTQTLWATKYREIWRTAIPPSCVPSIPPYSFIPPLHLPHSSSTLLLSASPLLVQVFPPVPKTSLRIDCLAVLMLNMHRISHLLSSASSPHPSLSLPRHPSNLDSHYPRCFCLVQSFGFHMHPIHFCSSLNFSSSSAHTWFPPPHPPLCRSPCGGARAEWRSRGISSMDTFQRAYYRLK